jgi:hypothetical protein
MQGLRGKPGRTILLAAAGLLGLPATSATAAVQFFINPDGHLNGTPAADPSRDLGFQAALRLPLYELDFARYGNAYVVEGSSFAAGPVAVRPCLLDTEANPAVDLSLNGGRLLETWPTLPFIAGIAGGGSDGAALLNRTYSSAGDIRGAAIEFTFTQPVEGFGAWILDDVTEANGFVLRVTETSGEIVTSPLLEAGNARALAVEGFAGAISSVGITRAIIEQRTLAGAVSSGDCFYVDHVQI